MKTTNKVTHFTADEMNDICVKCGKDRGDHSAIHLHCPIRNTSPDGPDFHAINSFEKKEPNA